MFFALNSIKLLNACFDAIETNKRLYVCSMSNEFYGSCVSVFAMVPFNEHLILEEISYTKFCMLVYQDNKHPRYKIDPLL